MDAVEVRNRTVSAVLAALGAAATTATFLYMFQDSSDAKAVATGKVNAREGDRVNARHTGPIAPGIPKAGDGSALYPDFVGGLNQLARNARLASPAGLGWFETMGSPTLLLTKPEHIKHVLTKTTRHALWGGLIPASEAFFGKSVLFVLEGDEWKKLRNILRDSFKIQRLDLLGKDVAFMANQLVNRLNEYADSGKPVDMNSLLGCYHLASIGKSSFDYDLDVLQKWPKQNDISDAFEFLLQELPRRSYSPDPKLREDYESGTEDNIKWKKAARSVRKVVTKAVEERLEDERRYGKNRGDLLDSMIASYRAATGTKPGETPDAKRDAEIMMNAIGDNLVEIFFAGYNTSVVAMCVALHQLAIDPELQRRAQAEVDEFFPDTVEVNEGFSASKLKLVSHIFHESLRIVPPAPLVARETTDMLTFDDIRVPAGTKVWIPADFLHKDPQAWGSTCDKFDPDRWEGPIVPGSYVPFSGGARDCIGKHFAELESVLALAAILKSFNVEPDPNYKFLPLFTGFGFRTADANSMQVAMRVILTRRTDTSAFIYDWTPVRIPRKSSNPLLAGASEDDLPEPPKFNINS